MKQIHTEMTECLTESLPIMMLLGFGYFNSVLLKVYFQDNNQQTMIHVAVVTPPISVSHEYHEITHVKEREIIII